MFRPLSHLDRFILGFDNGIKTLIGTPEVTERSIPGTQLDTPILTKAEKTMSSRLMRINHAGEVSAQALYQGQALTAKLPEVRESMEQAALEENDHLVWCQQRIESLGSHTSLLSPLWYVGSFAIGATAGKIGDKWSLGFVAETEKQVVKHLDEHLAIMSENDSKSRAILEQMKIDEMAHGSNATKAGGSELSLPVKALMGLMSKVMTKSTYWL